MKTSYSSVTFFLIFTLLGLNACSANKTISDNYSVEKASDNEIRVLDLNQVQPLDSISSRLKKARVVLVGESHTDYSHHLNQLAIIKSVHKSWDAKTSIGLEMVQQPYQSYLDDYLAGKITERQMLRGVQWYQRWKYDFRLYRPIFNYARQNNIPLVALNIPRELTKRVSKVGIAGLSSKERSLLPQRIDKSNSAYIARIKDVFSMHAPSPKHGSKKSADNDKAFNNFLDAQLAWDEGMAFNAAKYLKENPAKKMVILAGSGHLVNREGIPGRLDRQLGARSIVILSEAGESPSAKQADYLLFSADVELPPAGLLGISMAPSRSGVVVNSVSRHGAARKAGLLKGDIILALDQQNIKSPGDVSLWRLDKKPGELVKVKLRRKNHVLSKQLKLGKLISSDLFSGMPIHKK
jgi:uncharacterized iron-regulated protein